MVPTSLEKKAFQLDAEADGWHEPSSTRQQELTDPAAFLCMKVLPFPCIPCYDSSKENSDAESEIQNPAQVS